MGIFDSLFGSKDAQRSRPRRPRRKHPAPARRRTRGSPSREHPADCIPRLVAATVSNQRLTEADCGPDVRLMDLGIDELDAAEVMIVIEDHYGGRFVWDDGMDEAFLKMKIGEVIDHVAGAIGAPTRPAENSFAPQSPAQTVHHDPAVLCPSCGETVPASRKREDRPCPSCGRTFLDLGPLPEPIHDLPMGSAVSGLGIPEILEKEVKELPEWICPWCGANVGKSRPGCPRCGCDLTKTARLNLRAHVRGASPEIRGSFYFQSMHPMKAEVALCRLRRLAPNRVAAIGGTPELAAAMCPEKAPPRRRHGA